MGSSLPAFQVTHCPLNGAELFDCPDAVVGLAIAILIVLFSVQRFGTDKVGFSFAPAISLWFLCIGFTGFYNLFKHDPGVLCAFNPKYMFDYFRRNGKKGWISLGGVVLCITGQRLTPPLPIFSFSHIHMDG